MDKGVLFKEVALDLGLRLKKIHGKNSFQAQENSHEAGANLTYLMSRGKKPKTMYLIHGVSDTQVRVM